MIESELGLVRVSVLTGQPETPKLSLMLSTSHGVEDMNSPLSNTTADRIMARKKKPPRVQSNKYMTFGACTLPMALRPPTSLRVLAYHSRHTASTRYASAHALPMILLCTRATLQQSRLPVSMICLSLSAHSLDQAPSRSLPFRLLS